LNGLQAVDAVNRRLQVLTSIPGQARRTNKLRIIAGRGTHSSDGEATVAPAVLRYLKQHASQRGWRFAQHGGAFTVSFSR
jgi:DNA-nicking Smr family endonuclease